MDIHNQKTEYLVYHPSTKHTEENHYLKVKIGVTGALEVGLCGVHAFEQAQELGKEIVRQGGVLVTPLRDGFPLWAARGAKEEKGLSIGISPAANKNEHETVYHLPTEYIDVILYTGFGYTGSDLLLSRSCDALIVGCGRMDLVNECLLAWENNIPIGVLQGEWKIPQALLDLADRSRMTTKRIFFEKDPETLVKKIMEVINK
jgi:uncharacterized protein (TIGR00725 family)